MIDDLPAPPRSASELRASLADRVEDLRFALAELERRARRELDVGGRIAAHAPTALLAGFVAGAIVGAMTARR